MKKNLFRIFCLVAVVTVCLTVTKDANATKDPQAGVCCQTVANLWCFHPDGWIFDHAVWLAGHTICDD